LITAARWTGGDGREHAYDLADTMPDVTIGKGEHKGRVLELRQVTPPRPRARRHPPGPHLTTYRYPRRPRALAARCEQLTSTATRCPGTQVLLRYEAKEHPGNA
jgi:hypothetical protein